MIKNRLFLTVFSFVVILMAGNLSGQNLTISSIDVEGNVTADKSLILSVSDLSIGTVLTSTLTQDAIRAIYGLDLFADVSITGEISGQTIALTIHVEEYPRVTHIEYDGNNKIKDNDLNEVDSLKIGQLISPNQIIQAINNIKLKYQEKGYYRAEIEYELENDGESQIDKILKFKIKEHQKIRIRNIEFVGNEHFDDSKLAGKMGNKPKGFLRSGNFDPLKHDEDKEKIIKFYNEKGFIDAAILSDSIIIDEQDPSWMTIQFTVYEGLALSFWRNDFLWQ